MWKLALIVLVYAAVSIVIVKSGMPLINRENVETDIILVMIFCTLLALTKIDIKESSKKIIKFLQKNYLNIVTFIMFCLSSVNLMHNATKNMTIIREDASPVAQDVYAIIVNVYERLISSLKEYDNGLYRIGSKFQSVANDALNYGYNGISYSGSTYSKKLHLFLEKLGIRKSHVQVICNLENTKLVDMLLGVKYLIVAPNQKISKNYEIAYEEIYIENKIKIHENPYNLSLGYIVDKNIFNTTMDNTNTFELQNEMIKNMTNIQEDIYIKHKGKIEERIEEIQKNGRKYTTNEENPKIIYEFEAENSNDIYAYLLASSNKGINININGQESIKRQSFTGNEMISIGKKEIGEKVTIEIIPEDNEIDISQIYIYYENEQILKKHYDKLQSRQMQIKKIDNRRYKGSINIEKDNEYIMFTIPYEKGWIIKVDGEKVEYKEVLEALIAVELNKGEHEIVLEYMPSGIYVGMISTISGIIILGIIICKNKRSIKLT